MVKKIVITHGYSDSNKGDLAITQATVDGLKKTFPKAKITLMSSFRIDDPDFWYHNRKMKENDIKIIQGILPTPYIGSNSSFRINIIAVLRLVRDIIQLKASLISPFMGKLVGGRQYNAVESIRSADLVIVKGGQFIYNDKEDLRGNIFLWRTLQPIYVASKLKKKIIILGQSIGGFASEKSEKVAMKYLSLCDSIIVREKLSFDLLEKHGIQNVLLKPDTAFYIKKKEVSELLGYSEQNLLGITVVNWSFHESDDPITAKKQYILNLTEAIEKAYNSYKLIPVFIPQVTVRHHGKSDLDIIKTIKENLNHKDIDSIIIDRDFTASEMVGLYSKCKLLIGTRLHSCILAAVAQTPIIAVRYQGFKTQGVMSMLGMDRFVHDIHSLNSESLFDDIKDVVSNNEKIRTNIKLKTTMLVKDIEYMFGELNSP